MVPNRARRSFRCNRPPNMGSEPADAAGQTLRLADTKTGRSKRTRDSWSISRDEKRPLPDARREIDRRAQGKSKRLEARELHCGCTALPRRAFDKMTIRLTGASLTK